ncbi:Type II secretion system F domain protein [Alicyclobacillus acidocaldarius subsp. acidocaldarius Tc-4-1]|uniref:Type II secretion system F domain protein n=1 Tax=Alicyclobacillus acidocaldarius (strain Tc-4-1) TaxID=1048834 RepID=F8IDG6_ALIAT|nr:Type II secretion system F domain protein [Alicyclobacillus acidocaldarius subsp. acidocaldarius Tc-4-1]
MEREIALWMMEFSSMLQAGVDVRLAASTLRSSSAYVGVALSEAVLEQVERGQPLVQAFAEWVREMDWVGLAAAERAGAFAEGMQRVASRMMERVRWRRALVKQLAYPLILLCGTYGLFGFMMIAILPTLQKLAALTPGAAAHRGWTPTTLSGASLLIFTAGLVVVAVALLIKNRWPSAPIRPPFDRLIRRMRTERLADQLASQLEAGIGAWDAVAWIAGRRGGLGRQMRVVHDRVRRGASLCEAFASIGHVLDPLFLTLVEVGEITGEVADRLREGQRLMQWDVVHRLESIAQIAEPVAVAVMGLVVGVMVYSLMVPMYQAIARLS